MPHFQKSKNNLRIFDILKSGHPNRDPINNSNLREYENIFDGNPKTYWHVYIRRMTTWNGPKYSY